MNACPFPDARREARYWQDGWIEKRQRQADQEAEERREAIAAANRRADADSHRWAYADVAEALDKLGIDPHRLKAYLDGLADD
jgi:hypothetical protein